MSKHYKIEKDGTVTFPKSYPKAHKNTHVDVPFDFADHYYSGVPAKHAAPRCTHRGEDAVFTVGQRHFYGAQGSQVNPALYNVVLDCAGMVPKPFLLGASTRFRHLVNPQHFLRLHWPDMGIPPVAPQWWLRLARALPKRGHILAACVGGHGRTGTALALLALATQHVDTAEDAIALIRTAHCRKAIETSSQENYVRTFATWLDTLPKDKRVRP